MRFWQVIDYLVILKNSRRSVFSLQRPIHFAQKTIPLQADEYSFRRMQFQAGDSGWVRSEKGPHPAALLLWTMFDRHP